MKIFAVSNITLEYYFNEEYQFLKIKIQKSFSAVFTFV